MRTVVLRTSRPASRRLMLAGWSLLVWAEASAWAQYPPPNLKAEIKGPTEVALTWGPVTGTAGYHVWRAPGPAAYVRLTTYKIMATSYTDATASPSTTYRYRVVAVASNGQTYGSVVTVTTPAQSAVATLQRPGPAGAIAVGSSPRLVPSQATIITLPGNPTNFTAELRGTQVVLSWRLVAGVSWYLVGGPGMGPNGRQVQLPHTSVEGLAAGQYEWSVASLSEDRKPLTNWTGWPKAQLTIPTMPASGRYRISIAGFKVNHETYDDPLERDGKRDEVYVAAVLQQFNRKTGALVDGGTVQSKVYGDANGFPDRVPQGRASDVGGLMTGDVVPFGWDEQASLPSPNPGWFPLVLWEGSLANEEDALVLRPTIWEWDGDHRAFDHWQRVVSGDPVATWNSGPVQQTVGGTSISTVRGGMVLRVQNYLDASNLGSHYAHIVAAGMDRPIGVDERQWNYDIDLFVDRLLVLTREKIEYELTKSGAVGGTRGLLQLRFEDRGSGDAALSGDYTVHLRLERVP